MDKRFTIFAVLVMLLFIANQVVISYFFPPPPPAAKPANAEQKAAVGRADQQAADQKKEAQKKDEPPAGTPALPKPPDDVVVKPNDQVVPNDQAAPAVPPQWGALGSADPSSSYRMLVVWTNRGAALERVELNSPRYRDLDDRSGYLGPLALADAADKAGAQVRVVGVGTAAAIAGLRVDDVITKLDARPITSAAEWVDALSQAQAGQTVQISVKRGGTAQPLTATLERRPLQVIRPEADGKPLELVRIGKSDPLSFLMTLQQYDERVLGDGDLELNGVELRNAAWEVAEADETHVKFHRLLPGLGLRVEKTFRLDKVPPDKASDTNFPAYSLALHVAVTNTGDRPRKVAYRLGGPTGLPLEGAWYASIISRNSGGLRDVEVKFDNGPVTEITPAELAKPDFAQHWTNTSLDYAAVDAQYFAVALLPQKKKPDEIWFADVRPTRAGAVSLEKADLRLMDVSFRLDSTAVELPPGETGLKHDFQIFAGPKRPSLLAEYGPPGASLGELVYYGWFGFVARPMLMILHGFYHVVGNYGLAIIMLTVLVRGCMFPLSRKQAASAAKMQELQPEVKRIAEKYKNEPEKRTKAQQELFREHNYNPLGGCLLAFVQLPIFIGLYRSLSVDVELRQAPLISESIRWASNLGAPDMLWNWSATMPEFVTKGFLNLGPYLNVLPLVTIGLFIFQQKMFMPPAADEQAAMQQKMMQYMMIFMGFLFYKVPSGLCVYFIASSLWGIAERKLLPKMLPAAGGTAGGTAVALAVNGNGAPPSKKRQRGRK